MTLNSRHGLNLQHGLVFENLYERAGLLRVDAAFLAFLRESDASLCANVEAARAQPGALQKKQESELLIALAPHIDDFVAQLFGIEAEAQALSARHQELAPLYSCKRLFVQRRAATKIKPDIAATFDGLALEKELAASIAPERDRTATMPEYSVSGAPPVASAAGSESRPAAFSELAFARQVMAWQQDEAVHAADLDLAARYAAWALQTPAGRERHHDGVLFKAPGKLDFQHLVPAVLVEENGTRTYRIAEHHLRRREGFGLTDSGTDLVGALDQANYCIWCHHQDKDSCSTGLKEKIKTPSPKTEKQADAGGSDLLDALKPQPAFAKAGNEDGVGENVLQTGVVKPPLPFEGGNDSGAGASLQKSTAATFKKSPFGVTLAGCPLEQKISEFHEVKTQGYAIGALAMIVVDNPMCAATGHRICNDCMKSCIYQKQEPVNIPQSETRTLKDVLALPWGFEIYSLLTRWNPLDLRRPYPQADSGKRVLIAGMGPAGFTLAHHLMNDGHVVIGIDGLKIEPLPPEISGVDARGERVAFKPIRDIAELYEALGDRVMAGFGGVAEYGITVRWDKNFLKLIRLLLERRAQFALFGGVRFGGTLTVEHAFAPVDAGGMAFDHIALAAGAGRPTVLDMPNGLARGVRTASDFLMALQLTGAAKPDSIANMQIRLPVVVIGGGLTAIDTATEALAYYPLQVEKFLQRYDALVASKGKAAVRAAWTPHEQEIADEFLRHARQIREERRQAAAARREPRILELLRAWGGVTIAYRKGLIDSPSYTLNHEEVEKALQEGIAFSEGLSPLRIEIDEGGYARAIRLAVQKRTEDGKWTDAGETELAARTVLIAAGTQPNTVLAREDADNFVLDGRYFRACDETGQPVTPERASSKPAQARVLLSKRNDGRFISFFGDLHPSYFGNVVKAMGSAKQGYPVISGVLGLVAPTSSVNAAAFIAGLNRDLRATVHEVNRLTPTIVEVVVRAPLAARRFRPGQFYRLQNYETRAPLVDGTRLAMEGLALTGAWVDTERGLVSTIVLELGGSADLCALLEPGEPVVLMGPTGSPTEIPHDETVMLVGGGLGNAVLFSIGQALRQAGSKVLYFAGYKKMIDRYKVADIEAAADVVVWCSDEAPGFTPNRPQDRAFVGNIVQSMLAYAEGELGQQPLAMHDVDRIIAIGSDRMMDAVGIARHAILKPHLKSSHIAIGSINSPMQCMMKEICAQCLQPQIDPATGATRYVFSCFNQDQLLDSVDFAGLNARLAQNSVQEKLTAQWIDRCLVRMQRRPAAVA
ncbi:MAG: FAD-dependent oxidoreductase [Pseudomonadota bacterium]|nr:FAD-dependent oxidoreductase [Pseudomonadota bacterium]